MIDDTPFPRDPRAKPRNDSDGKASLWQIVTHTVEADETARSIALNHAAILREAAEQSKPVLICEDDVCLAIEGQELHDVLVDSFNAISSGVADLFYFGHIPWPALISWPYSEHVVYTFTPLANHSYTVTPKAASVVANALETITQYHCDRVMSRLDLTKMASYPPAFSQSRPPALMVEGMKKIGVSRSYHWLQSTTSWIARHILLILGLIILIIILVVVLVRQAKQRKKQSTLALATWTLSPARSEDCL
jgi:GR25 family glycosyltransferase involved in LPS biosynthesis